MRHIVFFFGWLFIISCTSGDSKKQTDSISQWITSNQEQLNLASDSIIQDYHERNKTDSNWISSSIVITKFAPNKLGELAEKAGDSTDCIVIELTFYKNLNQKKSILIAAEDSTCLNKLDHIILTTDSTDKFIFGKEKDL